jgi:2Fe-2S ferredoxin
MKNKNSRLDEVPTRPRPSAKEISMPKVKFIGGPTVVEVVAQPGLTLLEIAEENGARLGSACGGVCACSSCHAWILEGGDSLDESSDAEEDRLDMAFDVRPNSRLGCQVRVKETDLVVQLTEESLQTFLNEHPEHREG